MSDTETWRSTELGSFPTDMANDDGYSSLSDITSDFEYDDGESEVTDDEVVEDADASISDDSKPRAGRRAARSPKKVKKGKASAYVIKDALKAPRATTYTSQALYDQIVSGDIDLDPEYQRDVVWPEAKQVGLIDSIFRNFYIPPVIFAVSAHEDGSEHRICIDGKQRLTSIYRFMNGLIPHRDRKSGDKLWYQDSSSGRTKSRVLLPDKYRRLFANKQIVCVEYMDISDKDEREIFQRVQLGMALTPAEKLGVLKSPRADFVRHLQNTFFKDSTSSLSSLAWDRSRGTDFRCLATILWCLDRYYQKPALLANTGTITQLESWLSADNKPLSAQFKSNVTAGFSFLQAMLMSSDSSVSLPFRPSAADLGKASGRKIEKVSPIEFICMCLLVLIWQTKLSMRGAAKAIIDMRRVVRSEHIDLRMNTRVGKTMITFFKELKVEDYEDEADEVEEREVTTKATPKPKARTKSTKVKEEKLMRTSSPSKKRKRTNTENEDENGNTSDVASSPSKSTSAKPSKTSKTSPSDTPTTAGRGRLAGIRKATQQHQARAAGGLELAD